MLELNDNEKYATISKNLLMHEYSPESINVGDIMLYGSNTVVLFYKSFLTEYNYTKIGKVNDHASFVAALGGGNVNVIFDLQ